MALASLIGLPTLATAQGPAQFVYVVNNNFKALNPGGDSAPDPAGSPSTISVYKVQADFSLVKVPNPARSDGTFIGLDALSAPLGGANAVWNTVASILQPPLLGVNDFVNGPNGFSIDPATGVLTWLQSLPGKGNSGSAIALSNGGLVVYSGDYFAKTVRTIDAKNIALPVFTTENRFPANVVTVKLSPSEKLLAVGTDYLDDTFTVPARVHVLDLTKPPGAAGYPEKAGSPISTGGLSSMGGMAFAKDQRLVVANLLMGPDPGGTIRVLDLETMSTVGGLVSLPAPATDPVEVVFHPSGNFVYVACRSGHVAGFSYANGTLTPIPGTPWATGQIETQNLVINNSGSLLYSLNSGDIFSALLPSISGFTVATSGRLTKLPGMTTCSDTNFYPTGIAMYAPAPRFTTVSWTNPADIVYGTALGATQLDATASAPGTIAYSPASGTILNAGAAQQLQATFTPDDTVAYVGSSRAVTINVLKAAPTINWSNPADIYYGTALGAAQLNATATWIVGGVTTAVTGSFAYTPAAGSLLLPGTRTLSVTFTPANTTNYTTATKTVTINVLKKVPVLAWAAPSPLACNTPLGAAQLDATADVPGTFTYSPPAGTMPATGVQTLSVTFTPTDATLYTTATRSVQITVLPCGASADPRFKKQGVLDKLKALYGTKQDEHRLKEAIDAIDESLAAELWIDGTHLDPKFGHKVFDNERQAVRKLMDIQKDSKSAIPASTLQPFIDDLVAVDRSLAVVVLTEARATAGADAKELAAADADLATGDARTTPAANDFDNAIDYYRKAWEHGLRAMKKL